MEFKQNCLLMRGKNIALSFSAITGVNCINILVPLKIIEKNAFKDMSHIEEVILPFGLKYIDKSSFENCRKLRIVKCFINSKSKIFFQTAAFKNCQELDTVIFENERKINKPDIESDSQDINQANDPQNKMFPNQEHLLKNGLNRIREIVIEKDCFAGCSNLRVIFLIAKNVIIAEGAFSGCDKLTIVCKKNSDAERYAREHNIGIVNV